MKPVKIHKPVILMLITLLLFTSCDSKSADVSDKSIPTLAVTQNPPDEPEKSSDATGEEASLPVSSIVPTSTPMPTESNTATLTPTVSEEPNDSPEPDIIIETYDSDKAQEAGIDITLNGVRFPLPCTLADLGDKWSFDCGDMSQRYTGKDPNGLEYYYTGNFFTIQYLPNEGGERYGTGIALCYEEKQVAHVFFWDLIPWEEDVENVLISSILLNYDYMEKGYWEMEINDIALGNNIKDMKKMNDWNTIKETKKDKLILYSYRKYCEEDSFKINLSSSPSGWKGYNYSKIPNPITSISIEYEY